MLIFHPILGTSQRNSGEKGQFSFFSISSLLLFRNSSLFLPKKLFLLKLSTCLEYFFAGGIKWERENKKQQRIRWHCSTSFFFFFDPGKAAFSLISCHPTCLPPPSSLQCILEHIVLWWAKKRELLPRLWRQQSLLFHSSYFSSFFCKKVLL